jgi:hypothetical protein
MTTALAERTSMNVIDYSAPMLGLKQAVNAAERAMLEKDWEAASQLLIQAAVELRMLRANVELVKENNGIPYQV